MERVGLGLDWYVGRCSVDELVETHVPALRPFMASCWRLAQVSRKIWIAIERYRYVVDISRIREIGMDIAIVRSKCTLSHHGCCIGYVVNAIMVSITNVNFCGCIGVEEERMRDVPIG